MTDQLFMLGQHLSPHSFLGFWRKMCAASVKALEIRELLRRQASEWLVNWSLCYTQWTLLTASVKMLPFHVMKWDLKAFRINDLVLGAKHWHQNLKSQLLLVCPTLECLEHKMLAPSIWSQAYVNFQFHLFFHIHGCFIQLICHFLKDQNMSFNYLQFCY
jgi:hypothetical protein